MFCYFPKINHDTPQELSTIEGYRKLCVIGALKHKNQKILAVKMTQKHKLKINNFTISQNLKVRVDEIFSKSHWINEISLVKEGSNR